MSSTYEPIATQTASGSTATIEFTSIPTTYTDLIMVSNVYTNDPYHGALVSFIQVGNGSIDTGSNYSNTFITGNGSTASSSRYTSDTRFIGMYTSTAQSSNTGRSTCIMQFMNYSNTTTRKTVLWRENVFGDGAGVYAQVGLWRSTAAINRLKFVLNLGEFYDSSSTFTLYGIKAE
jgi:hypothetical protein